MSINDHGFDPTVVWLLIALSFLKLIGRDGNCTRGHGYLRVPCPMGMGMGTKFYPRARVRVRILTRGQDAGTNSRPRVARGLPEAT